MRKRKDVAWVFFHGLGRRNIAGAPTKREAIEHRKWLAPVTGGPIFRITPPKPKRRGRK